MNGSPRDHLRAPTRRLLLGAGAVLAVLLAGVMWLESLHPQLDPTGNAVQGVPALALDDAPTCRRFVDETPIEDIRERLASQEAFDRIREVFPAGGRVSSTQVVSCPSAYDGLTVTYVGEVVGELLPRRGGAWAQVNDDDYALITGPVVGHRERAGFNTGLSVWLEDELAERIEATGRPARRGDVVLLRGTILRADPQDGGGITLRADELQTLAGPLELDPPLHTVQVVVAIVLSLIAVGTSVWARRLRRR